MPKTETQPQHTPGPWEAHVQDDGVVFVTAPEAPSSGDLADLYHLYRDADGHQRVFTKHNAQANAHLIAAAPTLLERLKESTAWLIAERDSYYDSCSTGDGEVEEECDRLELARMDEEIDANRAAIAAAEGR